MDEGRRTGGKIRKPEEERKTENEEES